LSQQHARTSDLAVEQLHREPEHFEADRSRWKSEKTHAPYALGVNPLVATVTTSRRIAAAFSFSCRKSMELTPNSPSLFFTGSQLPSSPVAVLYGPALSAKSSPTACRIRAIAVAS
jgi:hypothetical protein